jgi:dephospho-CoA kinase
MLKVGLTGNLGSGKSLIAKIFHILSIPIYNADDVSKSFLKERNVQEKIQEAFGQEVFSAANEIDRAALGKIVFSDSLKLAILNAILHPLVREDFRKWCSSHIEKPYVIQEAAIIFESGFMDEYDKIIHVSCPEEIAIQRAMDRDNANREDILKRMGFQWKDKKKAAISDYIILNDGSELVIPQVLKIHNLLLKNSIMPFNPATSSPPALF